MLDREPRMALFFADYSRGLLGLRDGPRKVIYEIDSGRAKLFDLDHDREERVDLSSASPEKMRWYTEHLQKWSAACAR